MCGVMQGQSWVHEYRQIFSGQQIRENYYLDNFLSEKVVSRDFTQLIFSWNAYRTKKGYFLFSLGIQDKETGRWDWHKMVEWGVGKQCSFFSRGEFSTFNYARLEMLEGRKGSAFQVKVELHDKMNMDQLRGLFIVAADFKEFKPEYARQFYSILPSYKIKDLTPRSQIMVDHPRAGVLCSPTSMSTVLHALTGKDIDLLQFANEVYDPGLGVFGNWAFNTAHAFEESDEQFLFYATRLPSFKDLYRLLCDNIPVAVSVRGTLKGAFKPYNNGHILVVIGWNAERKTVICFDPRFETLEEVEHEYELSDFLLAWERSYRLAYKPELIV